MTESIPCPLCAASPKEASKETAPPAEPLFEVRERLIPLAGDFQYVRCLGCGLVYLNPRPTWEERQPYYNLDYRGYHRLETEPSALQRRGMRYGLEKRGCIISRHTSPGRHTAPGRLLDIGCSGGDFLDVMRLQAGWQVFGLERTPAIAARARTQYADLPVMVGDLEQAGLADASFDVLTLWTVLEHLSDPVEGLRACARLLRPGGLLVVRTVCLDSWARRLFGAAWIGFDAPCILTVFSRRTLRQMLETCGFEVCSMGENFHDFHPYLWCLHNLCAGRMSPESGERLEALAASWAVRGISLPFFALQTALGRNSFVTAVARKGLWS